MNGLGSTFIIVSILSRSIFKVRTWLTDFRSILMIFRMWKIIHLTKSCHYGRPRWLKIGQDGRKLPSWTRPSELFFKVMSMIKYQVLQVPKILHWLYWRFARSAGSHTGWVRVRFPQWLGRSLRRPLDCRTGRSWFDFLVIICLPPRFLLLYNSGTRICAIIWKEFSHQLYFKLFECRLWDFYQN